MADDDSNNALSCKVVLLGESGVGKTSIISRYTTNTFSSILMSTTGASFATKTMMLEEENQSVKFEIWDTAGQERYRALAKVFYKNASVCNELKENASKNISMVFYIIIFSSRSGWK